MANEFDEVTDLVKQMLEAYAKESPASQEVDGEHYISANLVHLIASEIMIAAATAQLTGQEDLQDALIRSGVAFAALAKMVKGESLPA